MELNPAALASEGRLTSLAWRIAMAAPQVNSDVLGDMMSAASFLRELTTWAATRSDVVALGLVGSHARGAARPDSDVDVVMLCNSPAAILESDWPSLFGEVESRTIEDHGALTSVRVWYRDGLEVEFGVAEPDWARIPLDGGTRAVLTDGMRILYDPERLLELAARAAVA